MDHLCASGITNLDNVYPDPYQRALRIVPDRMGIRSDELAVVILREARNFAQFEGREYATKNDVDDVALKMLADYGDHRVFAS